MFRLGSWNRESVIYANKALARIIDRYCWLYEENGTEKLR